MEGWTVRDAIELYGVRSWGAPYVTVNGKGNVEITPSGPNARGIDLKDLVDDLVERGLSLPLLLRFSDILRSRIAEIHDAFAAAIADYEYQGKYLAVMPIKVNQQRHVVEEILEFGRPWHVGLEAGSKPELLIALALVDDPEALVVCNGYKDAEYLETALLALKLGRQVMIIVDRFAELEGIISISKRLGVKPRIGVRAKLTAKGSGKWVESAGERSKFGLTARELVAAVQRLREVELLSSLELLHFHMGSQITNIGSVKNALREATRLFVDLTKMGAPLAYLDVGGGLAVDYDGSRTNFHSSANYSLQEYANDIIGAVHEACEESDLQHPIIISESGRALVAHHAVLVFNVLGVNTRGTGEAPRAPTDEDENVLHGLWETYNSITRKSYQEAFNDLLELRQEAKTKYIHGQIDLEDRAYVEELQWACAQKILRVIQNMDYVPEELQGLEKDVSDTYFCNFSVFQSAPDHWAVKQLFPVMPIHRLKEKPTRPATIADLTCDSDGKIDQFIDLHDVRDTLPLHARDDDPYYLAVFMVGAYQEVLGDLHNLFGDTNAVHVHQGEEDYYLTHVIAGDSVAEVIGYMQYDKRHLVDRVRSAAETALRNKKITLEEVRSLMKHYEERLAGYTYLDD